MEEAYMTNPSGVAPSPYARMKLHTRGSVRRGADGACSAFAGSGLKSRTSARRLTKNHRASQVSPIAPVNRKAGRHPHIRKIGVTTIGVIMAPSDPPLYA